MYKFSLTEYGRLISDLKKAGYKFLRFRDLDDQQNPSILMRHDVDFNLDFAGQLAEYENRHGIVSTYFIMTSCEYYNIRSPSARLYLQKIVNMGHEIGLHWDSSSSDESNFRETFENDILALALASQTDILSASQHIPTDNPSHSIHDLIENDAYSLKIREEFDYVSDSSMSWRSEKLLQLIFEKKNIQLLTHPVWWIAPSSNRESKLIQSLQQIQNFQTTTILEFIEYMNDALSIRAQLDSKFEEKFKW